VRVEQGKENKREEGTRKKKNKNKNKYNESERGLERPIATLLSSPRKDVWLKGLQTANFFFRNLITY
jgi:hypothetical protein